MGLFDNISNNGKDAINGTYNNFNEQLENGKEKVDNLFSEGKNLAKNASDKFNSIMNKLNGKKGDSDKPDPNDPDKRDFCGKPSENSVSGDSFKNKVKKVIDKIFDPLDSSKGAYANAGYTPTSMGHEITSYEISYDLINLEPNNPYDIYYRDEDEKMWNKNRRAATRDINYNIQDIHETIVVPLRHRVKEMFSESVIIRVEYCFMCIDALIKNRLPLDHLFSKGRAVLLIVENEKASVIYDDILRFCSDDNEDIDLNDKESAKPFEYGIMKLCNNDNNKQRIYITLPFSEEEIQEDPLLSNNKSNFYHSIHNDLGISPDSQTSTKIFPSYHPDNDVEDFFNENDDIEDKMGDLEDKIQNAKNEQNSKELEKLNEEKYKLEQAQSDLLNPNPNLSDLEKNKLKAEELYKKFPTSENKKLIELATKELNKFPSDEDTLTVAVGKINSISVSISTDLDITGNHANYFIARKMYKLKIAIECRKAMKFVVDDNYINEILNIRINEYNKIKNDKFNDLYNEYNRKRIIYLKEKSDKAQEEIDKLPPIIDGSSGPIDRVEIDLSDFNEKEPTLDDVIMDGIVYPTKENIIAEKKKEFDSVLIELERIYNEMDIEALDIIQTDFPLNVIKFSEEKKNELEKIEYDKFTSLKELSNECDRYKKYILSKRKYNQYKDLYDFFIENSYPDYYRWLLDNESDREEIMDFYFKILKKSKIEDNIDEKIILSKNIANLCKKNNFDISYIPNSETEKYKNFIFQYLDIEIEYYTISNNMEKVAELQELKNKYIEYANKSEYSKMKLEDFQSDIFQFGKIEYSTSKLKFLMDIYSDETLDNDKRIIAYISYIILNESANMNTADFFKNCNDIGKKSLSEQILSNLFDEIYKEPNSWLKKQNLVGIDSINDDILRNLKTIDGYITGKIASLHSYLNDFNNFIRNILYNQDMDVRVNKVYKANKRNYSFLDYGFEYVTLQKQIGDSLSAKDNEASFRARLKSDRLMMKRQLIYLKLDENSKKISNFELEMVACIDFGKINRFKKIKDVIIPDLKRLKELKDSFIPEDNEKDNYEYQKRIEKERLEFLYSQNTANVALLFRKSTIEITMDYENERGIFENINKTKDEKYLMYLELLKECLIKENNQALNIEIKTINDEISYIQNLNNEKAIKKSKLIQELKEKKIKIEEELAKRENDKEYLHFKSRILSIENNLKLKFKEFVRIENLPSKGVIMKFPFKEYEEFKKIYEEELNLPTKISEYEIIDSYSLYSELDFNYFDKNKSNIIKKMHSIWENVTYEPDTATMTEEINNYILLLDEGINKKFNNSIGRSLYCLNGFIEMNTILMSDNNSNFTSALLVKLRRTEDFIIDLKYFLKTMFKENEEQIDSIKVIKY